MLLTIGTENSIICIDPNPTALHLCAKNLINNNLSEKATFINAFVGDSDNKEIEFYSSLNDAAGSIFRSFAKTSSSIGKSKKVSQQTADTICNKLNFIPNLVKIDVEGAESMVLNGLINTAKYNPYIFVEVHSGEELSIIENTKRILKWATDNSYIAYYLKDHCILKNDMVKNRGRYHTLLVPKSLEFPKYLLNINENAQIQIFDKK
jgi:FkbM family methyltransferase